MPIDFELTFHRTRAKNFFRFNLYFRGAGVDNNLLKMPGKFVPRGETDLPVNFSKAMIFAKVRKHMIHGIQLIKITFLIFISAKL